MSDLVIRDEGAQKYMLIEFLAQSRINPDLKGTDAGLLDLEYFPESIIQLGQAIDVAPQKLALWMRAVAFERAVAMRIKQISAGYLVRHLEDVNRILVNAAKGGDKDAMKLFYARVDKELYDAHGEDLVTADAEKKKDHTHVTQINIQIQDLIEKHKRSSGDKWEEPVFDDADFHEV